MPWSSTGPRYECMCHAYSTISWPTTFSLNATSTHCPTTPLQSAYGGVAFIYAPHACDVQSEYGYVVLLLIAFCAVKSGVDQLDTENMKIASVRFCFLVAYCLQQIRIRVTDRSFELKYLQQFALRIININRTRGVVSCACTYLHFAFC